MGISRKNDAATLLGKQPLGLEDAFVFHCKACGKCCKNRKDIILSGHDVYRLARFLGRSTREIAERYCELYEGKTSHMPVMWLRPVLPDDACPFLRGRKCSVHAAKPCVCRVFPLMRVYEPTGSAIYFQNDACKNEGTGPIKVKNWIGDFSTGESNLIGRVWTDIILRLAYCIAPERYHCSSSVREKLLSAIAVMLYDIYDIQEPFLPQLKRNIEFLIEHLKYDFSIVVPTMQEFLDLTQESLEDKGGSKIETQGADVYESNEASGIMP